MAENLLTRPRISGTIKNNAAYRTMGFGSTSRILLIGHGDGLSINDPYQVLDMQEVVNLLQADTTSPLLRGVLEAYNSGCRDIWICAAAPMKEYISDVDLRFDKTQDVNTISGGTPYDSDLPSLSFDVWGGTLYITPAYIHSFYEKYYERLEVTYSILREFDFPEVIVPLEAPFYYTGGVDFLTQLANHCNDTFLNTGAVQMGVIGTRRPSTMTQHDAITGMVNDSRIASIGDIGKFVMVAAGEGLVSVPQMSLSYKVSVATQTAANIATLNLDRGLTYSKLTNIINLDGPDYTAAQLDLLTSAKINPAVRTTKSKRGSPFQTVLLTDNTVGSDGSDFWSISQMKLIASCANTIRSMGYSFIGSIDYAGFKQKVYDYLNNLVEVSVIKSYTLQIERLDDRQGRVGVTVSLTPFLGIRQVYFSVETGPGT